MRPVANDDKGMVLDGEQIAENVDEDPLSLSALLHIIIENQVKIFGKLEFLEKRINCFITFKPPPVAASNCPQIPVTPEFNKIDSIEDVTEFEKQLESDEFVQLSVRQYSIASERMQ